MCPIYSPHSGFSTSCQGKAGAGYNFSKTVYLDKHTVGKQIPVDKQAQRQEAGKGAGNLSIIKKVMGAKQGI